MDILTVVHVNDTWHAVMFVTVKRRQGTRFIQKRMELVTGFHDRLKS